MNPLVSPQIFLVSLLAGRLNRKQQKFLEYLREENQVLKQQLGGRLPLTDEQRRRLAAKGAELGRQLLGEVATLVTPEAILRRHLQQSLKSGPTRAGRPGVHPPPRKSKS